MSEVIVLNDENWTTEVLGSSLPMLVDLWAAWCGPCKLMQPEVEDLAAQEGDRLRVASLDVDHFPILVQDTVDLDMLPTCLLFVNGEIRKQIQGYHGKGELLWEIESYLRPRLPQGPSTTSFSSEY